MGYYERYGFVQDHVVKNFFTDNYPEPIIDNGKPCVDMNLPAFGDSLNRTIFWICLLFSPDGRLLV